jgi:hypothetical protein
MLFPSFGKDGESHNKREGCFCKMGNKYVTIYTARHGRSDSWRARTLYRSLDRLPKKGLLFFPLI